MATENNKNRKYVDRKSLVSITKKLENTDTKNSIQFQFRNFINFIKIKHLS